MKETNFLNLRQKTLFVISITLLVLIIILYVMTQNLFTNNYLDLENTNTIQNIKISQDTLFNELNDLESATNSLADDNSALTFIQNNNSEYIMSNLADNTFKNSQINMLLFINTSNQIVYSEGYNLSNNSKTSISENATNYILNDDNLLKNNNTTEGILLLPEGPMLISTAPITNDADVVEGTLITGRYLNTSMFLLNSSINLSSNILPVDASDHTPTYHELSSY